MKESIYNIKFKYDNKDYIYNSRNNGIIEFCEEDLEDEQNVRYLLNEKYYVDNDCDEVQLVVDDVNKEIESSEDELKLTILLTKQCNFRCVYCYQERETSMMTVDDAKKLIQTIEERLKVKEHKKMFIHFFGGEPLLNINVLLFLDKEFKRIADLYKVEYLAFITTNGSLLNRDILKLVKFAKIQLTFDGLEDTHNSLRRSTVFSYEKTIELIPVILEFCDVVSLRFNVCEENKNDLIPFIDYVMTRFGKNKIDFHIARTIKFSEKDKFTMVNFNEYCELELQARLRLQYYGKKLLLPIRKNYNCGFINKNAFSISPNLHLYSCEGDNGAELEMFSKKSMEIKKNYKVDNKCKKCNILPLCLGGCEKTKALGYESCAVEKNIINELLVNYIKQQNIV